MRVIQNPSLELLEVFEQRYNLCMLFYCLKRDDKDGGEDGGSKFDAFDSAWLREMFVKMLGVPSFTVMCSLEGHTQMLLTLEVFEDRLYSASFDNTIKIWNCKDGNLIKTLFKHSHPVRFICFYDANMYSGSYDGSIKVWSLSDYTLLKTMNGGPGIILSVIIAEGKLYAGTGDGIVNVFDCDQQWRKITNMTGQTDGISCLTYNDGKLYSGSADNTVKVWNCNKNYELITTLRGHETGIKSLAISYGKVYSKTGNTINVWSSSDYSTVNVFKMNKSIINLHNHDYDGKLLIGDEDGDVLVWDCSDDTLVTTMKGHTDAVHSLNIHEDTRRLFTVSKNLELKVWDGSSGDYRLMKSVEGESGFVWCLKFCDDKFFVGRKDNTISMMKL